MSKPGYRRVGLCLLVVLVLGGIYAVARTGHAGNAAARRVAGGRATVSTAERVCPAPGSGGATAASVALAAVPGSAKAGSAVIRALAPAGSSSAGPAGSTVTRPGVLQLASVPVAPALTAAEQAGQPGSSPSVRTVPGQGGVQVSATGALAQGLEVEQTGPGGLVTAQCGAPGTSFWFVGPGQTPAGGIELYLTNTGSEPADAQVQALTDAGTSAPVLGNADNGITVPPDGVVVQSLTGLLQGSNVVALNVTTTVGQVVAAVRESQSAADDGSWLPVAQPPAERLTIPGLISAGAPELYIAVPGTAAADVKLTAITQKGSYQPTGGTGIDLLGGTASIIPLPSLGGVAGAVSISATAPVVAAMLVSGGPAGSAGALAVSSDPVQEQGVLAANPARSTGSTWLVLSAPGKAASVRIRTATATTPASGKAGPVVHIRAKSSAVVSVEPPAAAGAGQFTVVVTPLPGSGPVYGGRLINVGGTWQSILPVPSSLTWIPVPGVSESLATVLGG
ncbi:MAG: DUF5719 family protein [Streptosporangiaceae bacterium]